MGWNLRHKLQSKVYAVAVLMLVLGTASQAGAYLLPADFLLRLLVEQRHKQNIKDLTIQLDTVLEGHAATVEERLYIKGPDRLRLTQQKAEDEWVYIARGSERASGTKGSLRSARNSPPELLPILFAPPQGDLDNAAAAVLKAIKATGIDTSVVSLGRLHRDVGYIIGARPWETEAPQAWLHKETHLPMRLILFDKSGDKPVKVDVRMLEYGGSVNGNWFPGVIEVYHNDALVRRAETSNVLVNQNLPETLFALPRG